MGNIAETNALCLENNRKIANISPVKNRLIEAHVKISQDEPDEMEFLHSVFCQVSLPKRKTIKRTFERRNGNVSLLIEAGSLGSKEGWVEQPLPYGTKPRLILIYLTTEAVRRKSRVIPVGNSMADFLKKLGLHSAGGKDGPITFFKKQMSALVACRMTIKYVQGDKISTKKVDPFDGLETWENFSYDKKAGWPTAVEMTEKFYDNLMGNAVPLDNRAIASLSHNSTSLDIYAWLAHRLCRINRPQGIKLTWANLHSQFGQEYKSVKDFRKTFLISFKETMFTYPEAKVEIVRGGLLLKQSRPPIKKAFVLGC